MNKGKVNKFRGLRADRFKQVMKEHGATVDDIFEEVKRTEGGSLFSDDIERLVNGECSRETKWFTVGDIYAICSAVNVSADYLLGLSDKVN